MSRGADPAPDELAIELKGLRYALFKRLGAATVPSLFDVYHENASLCGLAARPARARRSRKKIQAYLAWLANKAGLYPFNASEVIGGGIAWRSRHNEPVMGVTYGEQRGRNAGDARI